MHVEKKTMPPIKKLLIRLAVLIFNLWFCTCRIQIIGREYEDYFLIGGHKAVGATWHRGIIFLVWFFRKVHPMVMISSSKDGDLLAAFAKRLGHIPIRGSSSRGGRKALRKMIAFFQGPGSGKAATVLDGPRGPRYVAKSGMIVLAMKAGVPLVPIMMSASPAFTFRNAWDRTIIPLPFSKITVMYTEPFNLPKTLNSQGLEKMRVRVERRLNSMMAQCDKLSGYNENIQRKA